MSFEVDRYTSAWAHIALCADLTWASEPPDDFIVANQRLWAQNCRVSHVLQDSRIESSQDLTNSDLTDNHLTATQNNGSSKRSVKDVIPESRLAQFYGNFYYDDVRENCYTCSNEKVNVRYNGQGCENSDLTECWMLPEVEYWFRKLVDNSDRTVPRRRRQYKMLADNDFERWNSSAERSADEAVLEAKIRSVRPLWNQHSITCQSRKSSARAPSPPPAPRKIRARRRQPKSLAALAPPPPAYCVDSPTKLLCNPTYKFDIPRHPQLTEYQRAMGRLSASVQALMRSNASRCPPYRGTNVSRYAPTIPRPTRFPDRRYGVWWPRDNQHRTNHKHTTNQVETVATTKDITPKDEITETKDDSQEKEKDQPNTNVKEDQKSETSNLQQKDNIIDDGQLPSTSAAAKEGLRKKRLYSTVLSTNVPPPSHINAVGSRLSKNLHTPGLIKLNPKIAMSSRIRLPIVDNKFEELEKEALEQYKDSDESIDTKFRELEKQAVEQYSTSNSNTSCSSNNSGDKKTVPIPSCEGKKEKRLQKPQEDKSVDSVVIYSQNFPDLNEKKHSKNLKNFHIPLRGEKKEVSHRLKCLRNAKNGSKGVASDSDYEAKDTAVKGSKGSKGAMRWTLHVMPPKKRHLTLCVSDFSSDDEMKDTSGSIKDARPCIKKHLTGKIKLSAHGGGDLHPIIRKT